MSIKVYGKQLLAISLFTVSALLCVNTNTYAWHYYHHGYYHHGGWRYHHAGWGWRHGWSGYYGGWAVPGVYVNTGYWGPRCAWRAGHRNLYGHWVRAHRVCW